MKFSDQFLNIILTSRTKMATRKKKMTTGDNGPTTRRKGPIRERLMYQNSAMLRPRYPKLPPS